MRPDATRPAHSARLPNRTPRALTHSVRDPPGAARGPAKNLTILIADDDPSMRFLLALELRNTIVGVDVLQAADGTDAVELGVRHRPQIALLDVCMPGLNGIEAARILHKAQPEMKVALQIGDAAEYRDDASALGIPLFDKRDLEQQLAWIKASTSAAIPPAARPPIAERVGSTREQQCSRCGYRISSRTTPPRCPMCQTSNPWIPLPEGRPVNR
jgi:CheY-like chemotaxis protein